MNKESKHEIEKKMFKLCKNTGRHLLQTLYPPSDESDTEAELPETMMEIANSVKNTERPLNLFQTNNNNIHTADIMNTIDDITTGQRENPEWSNYMKGRITTSLFS